MDGGEAALGLTCSAPAAKPLWDGPAPPPRRSRFGIDLPCRRGEAALDCGSLLPLSVEGPRLCARPGFGGSGSAGRLVRVGDGRPGWLESGSELPRSKDACGVGGRAARRSRFGIDLPCHRGEAALDCGSLLPLSVEGPRLCARPGFGGSGSAGRPMRVGDGRPGWLESGSELPRSKDACGVGGRAARRSRFGIELPCRRGEATLGLSCPAAAAKPLWTAASEVRATGWVSPPATSRQLLPTPDSTAKTGCSGPESSGGSSSVGPRCGTAP